MTDTGCLPLEDRPWEVRQPFQASVAAAEGEGAAEASSRLSARVVTIQLKIGEM